MATDKMHAISLGRRFWVVMAFVAAACVSSPAATNPPQTEIEPSELIGTWDIALYYAEGQPPATTKMTISNVSNGSLVGTFYGSPFETGRIRSFEGALIFTFVTRDGSGPYLHSGRYDETGLSGQTLSEARDFLTPWRAIRAMP